MTVIWFTGLSGSGKTTIAGKLAKQLTVRGIPVEQLDGDTLRERFPTGFSKDERTAHIGRVAYIASLLEKHGIIVLVSLISPYREARQRARVQCREFIEVHVSAPLAVCEARDVKGLYKKARGGELASFTGIDDPYEPPEQPELTLDTAAMSLEASVATITQYLTERGLIA